MLLGVWQLLVSLVALCALPLFHVHPRKSHASCLEQPPGRTTYVLLHHASVSLNTHSYLYIVREAASAVLLQQ